MFLSSLSSIGLYILFNFLQVFHFYDDHRLKKRLINVHKKELRQKMTRTEAFIRWSLVLIFAVSHGRRAYHALDVHIMSSSQNTTMTVYGFPKSTPNRLFSMNKQT